MWLMYLNCAHMLHVQIGVKQTWRDVLRVAFICQPDTI